MFLKIEMDVVLKFYCRISNIINSLVALRLRNDWAGSLSRLLAVSDFSDVIQDFFFVCSFDTSLLHHQ